MKNRPVNLNLMTMRFPITALVSIVHRGTGVLLFFMIPFFLWALNNSLASPAAFLRIKSIMGLFIVKWILWGSLSALFYHLVAGIRHLLMDCHVGETLAGGRLGARCVSICSLLIMCFLLFYLF